jgi:hypothetical protein
VRGPVGGRVAGWERLPVAAQDSGSETQKPAACGHGRNSSADISEIHRHPLTRGYDREFPIGNSHHHVVDPNSINQRADACFVEDCGHLNTACHREVLK